METFDLIKAYDAPKFMGLPEDLTWTPAQKAALKYMLEMDGIQFMRYFFKLREGISMIMNWHHFVLDYVLQAVLNGKVNRLIINIPPGYGKTELAVINFIMRGLALNPMSRFIHLSYGDTRAQLSSSIIKRTMEMVEFQDLWPMKTHVDTRSKGLWHTDKRGGLLAKSSGGEVSGFRAGHMIKGFTGALIIDDPIKPEDAISQVIRDRINNQFHNTSRSRLALETVPVIIIMQRLHEMDLCGYLLTGGGKEGKGGDMWHHLRIPALMNYEDVYDVENSHSTYPKEYKNGIPISISKILNKLREKPRLCKNEILKFCPESVPYETALWSHKQDIKELKVLEYVDSGVFSAQSQQNPQQKGGNFFKSKWFKRWDILPPDLYVYKIFCDTAQKTEEHHDYSVFQCWGFHQSGIYLVDQVRGKWEAPGLESALVDFWNKHKPQPNKNHGATCVYIEDKSSGSSLIQSISANYNIPVFDIQRHRDKVLRAHGTVKYINAGYVYIPANAHWVSDYLLEFEKFTADMSHEHDDQIDPTMDAIDDLASSSDMSYDKHHMNKLYDALKASGAIS